MLFVSSHHTEEEGYAKIPELVRRHFGEGLLLGCSARGVIGSGREVEGRPGLAMTAGHLPDVRVLPFYVDEGDLPDKDSAPETWEVLANTRKANEPTFILLSDPFSVETDDLLSGLDYAFPGCTKIGGLASGGRKPRENTLYLREHVYRSGCVGVSLQGSIAVDTLVAQACRPVGEPMRVTACDDRALLEVEGRKPLDVLGGLFDALFGRDRELVGSSLNLGIAMEPVKEAPGLGDFLIRNIIGVDYELGALAVSETLREGMTVQFHLRDAETSEQEVGDALSTYSLENTIDEDSGALLFSSLGRGSGLYGRADHDTDMFRRKVGPMPLTGFFCDGEIGPVGGSTFLHAYTSSFGIFRRKET
jgi:small ligand-binding sensory domain FIST